MDQYLCLVVPKNPAATDLTYTVQATSDLSNPASWTSNGLLIKENTTTTLRVQDNIPMSNGQPRFMRLKVIRQP